MTVKWVQEDDGSWKSRLGSVFKDGRWWAFKRSGYSVPFSPGFKTAEQVMKWAEGFCEAHFDN